MDKKEIEELGFKPDGIGTWFGYGIGWDGDIYTLFPGFSIIERTIYPSRCICWNLYPKNKDGVYEVGNEIESIQDIASYLEIYQKDLEKDIKAKEKDLLQIKRDFNKCGKILKKIK